ncbi:MAG: hypothetical protein ABIX28_04805, partial [Vicinamibacterales bacterium]
MNPRDLAQHLRFYEELGVTGISRDPKWRQRAGDVTPDLKVGPTTAIGPSPVGQNSVGPTFRSGVTGDQAADVLAAPVPLV